MKQVMYDQVKELYIKKLFVLVLSVLSIMLLVCASCMKYDVNGYANSNGVNIGYARLNPLSNGLVFKLKTSIAYTGVDDRFDIMGLYSGTDFSYPINKGL